MSSSGSFLEFAEPGELERAARALSGTPDNEALTLHVASDGAVHGVRAVLDTLDSQSIRVAGLSVRPADLDDVFLSLTGRRGGVEGDPTQ
jgi:ABC-2 type transport system ATP-binding protein